MNRALSIRSKNGSSPTSSKRHPFSFSSLRGQVQPELSRKLYRLIKSENHLIQAHEAAGKERISIASQISDWGEATSDDAVSELSDKIGVILAELGEQEDLYAHNLDDSRAVLKHVRNMEKSVQPTRDHKTKLTDEIAKLKAKEPESTKIPTLEQELVRAEAESLVAEAQLTNITRQKFKEAYALEFAATIERAEKQLMLARHGRRLLNLLDDTPVVPGNTRPPFQNLDQARQILNDAEEDLRDWRPDFEEVPTNAQELGQDAMIDTANLGANGGANGGVHGGTAATVGSEGSAARGQNVAGGGNQVTTEGIEPTRVPTDAPTTSGALGGKNFADPNPNGMTQTGTENIATTTV
ncbi:Eisosome component PIL1-domain-containing protein [Xylogone sp. PMI_703]|nr:Eisosome component PIL1-domain-containing protein [Xylogone sp. PMI_703]